MPSMVKGRVGRGRSLQLVERLQRLLKLAPPQQPERLLLDTASLPYLKDTLGKLHVAF